MNENTTDANSERLEAKVAALEAQLASMTSERDTLTAKIATLSKERDDWKAKAEPLCKQLAIAIAKHGIRATALEQKSEDRKLTATEKCMAAKGV